MSYGKNKKIKIEPNGRFVRIEAVMKAKMEVKKLGIVARDSEDHVFEEFGFVL